MYNTIYAQKFMQNVKEVKMKDLIAQKIKTIRSKKRISQTELSKRTHLHRNTISNFENSKRNPRVNDLKKIANALDVSIEELL